MHCTCFKFFLPYALRPWPWGPVFGVGGPPPPAPSDGPPSLPPLHVVPDRVTHFCVHEAVEQSYCETLEKIFLFYNVLKSSIKKWLDFFYQFWLTIFACRCDWQINESVSLQYFYFDRKSSKKHDLVFTKVLKIINRLVYKNTLLILKAIYTIFKHYFVPYFL